MALPKTAELSASELELKRRGRRRLIGAVTLGLVIVVFLPMLFDAEPKLNKAAQQEISIQLPSKETLRPLPAPTAEAPLLPSRESGGLASEIAVAAPVTEDVEPRKSVISPAQPAVKVPSTAATTPLSKIETSATKPAKTRQGFVVQIGAFKDADNAQQTAVRMKEAKLPVYTDNIATKNGSVTRVRVGPFNRKEQADAALAQVKLAGADGKIVPLP